MSRLLVGLFLLDRNLRFYVLYLPLIIKISQLKLPFVMRKTIFAFLMLISSTTLFAQDIIQQKDGVSIKVKVKEVSKTEVKYLKFENLDGPLYILSLTDIDFIKYENGLIESYTQHRAVQSPTTNTAQSEVFFETKPNIERVDAKDVYIQGQSDAAIFYKKYKAAAGWTCATTILFSPLFGLIPAVATSLTPPAIHNLNAPNVEKLKVPEYNKGYTDFAKKKKRQRVWINFGIGTAVWGILTIISSSSR